MEKQTIDLLPHIFRKIRVPFSFNKIILIQLVSSGLIALICFVLMYWSSITQNKTFQIEEDYRILSNEIDSFRNSSSKPSIDERLKIRVSRYEEVLRSRKHFFDKMDSESFGFSGGFSEYLQAFSRQSFPELWFNEIDILANGEGLGLKGYAVHPKNIPELVKQLQNEPIFRGVLFDDLTLGRVKTNEGDFVSFVLRHGTMSQSGSE